MSEVRPHHIDSCGCEACRMSACHMTPLMSLDLSVVCLKPTLFSLSLSLHSIVI
jgi:hypothetical protein